MIFVILAHYIIIILATKNMHHFPPHLILTVLCSLTRQSKMCFYVSVKLENTLCNEDCIIILKNSICTLLKVVERIYKEHFNQCSLQRLLKKLLTVVQFLRKLRKSCHVYSHWATRRPTKTFPVMHFSVSQGRFPCGMYRQRMLHTAVQCCQYQSVLSLLPARSIAQRRLYFAICQSHTVTLVCLSVTHRYCV